MRALTSLLPLLLWTEINANTKSSCHLHHLQYHHCADTPRATPVSPSSTRADHQSSGEGVSAEPVREREMTSSHSFIHQSTNSSIHPPTYPSIGSLSHPSSLIHQSMHPLIHPLSIHPLILYQSTNPSIHLSIQQLIHHHQSIHQLIHLLSINPSIHQYTH